VVAEDEEKTEAVTLTLPEEDGPRPWLHAKWKLRGEGKTDLMVELHALIVAEGRLFYFEIAPSSDALAHAFMGLLVEGRIEAEWTYHEPSEGEPRNYAPGVSLKGPERPVCQNTRIQVPGEAHRYVHHVAALDCSGKLLVVQSMNDLWLRVRDELSCPTLAVWGEVLAPKLVKAGVVVEAQSFGIGKDVSAYVLAEQDEEAFDGLVSAHVKAKGF
jgi:hypothetical protein